RIFGSADSDEVSELVWMHNTFNSYHLLDGKRPGRRLRTQNDLAAVRVDQLARVVRRFVGFAFRIAGDDLEHASAQAAGRVELVDLELKRIARRDTELRDTARQNRRDADLDGFGFR